MQYDVVWSIFNFSRPRYWLKLCFLEEAIYDYDEVQKWRRVAQHENTNLEKVISELDNGELAIWLRAYGDFNFGEFYLLIDHNRIDVNGVAEFMKRNPRLGASNMLQASIEYGRLDICKWIVENYTIEKRNLWLGGLFGVLATVKYLPIIKWVTDHFSLKKDDLKYTTNICRHFKFRASDLETLKWIIERFEITKDDLVERSDQLHHTVHVKSLEMLSWLVDQYGLQREDVIWPKNMLINTAIEYNCIEILDYLKKRFDLSEYDLSLTGTHTKAMWYAKKDTIKWLFTEFNLSHSREMFRRAVRTNGTDVTEWLVDYYDIPRSEIAEDNFNVLRDAIWGERWETFEFLICRYEFTKKEIFEDVLLLRLIKTSKLYYKKWLIKHFKLTHRETSAYF